jgi:hypothetical protein
VKEIVLSFIGPLDGRLQWTSAVYSRVALIPNSIHRDEALALAEEIALAKPDSESGYQPPHVSLFPNDRFVIRKPTIEAPASNIALGSSAV